MDLAQELYRVTKGFPSDERYGMTNQLRRAAVSIPSNIAEGQGRGSSPEMVRFLRIAYGSLREIETQVLLASRFAYLSNEECDRVLDLAAEVGKLINGLMKSNQ